MTDSAAEPHDASGARQPRSMKVVAFVGPSGVGKTTLMSAVITELSRAGQRVSALKHAHERFDIDRPGKDSWRHREAGAREVLVASRSRMALLREYDHGAEPRVHELIAELAPCDWLLVEGFKHADLPKIEVRRSGAGDLPPLYPDDPFIVALASDHEPPVATSRPVFSLDQPHAIARWLLESGPRFDYEPAHHVQA